MRVGIVNHQSAAREALARVVAMRHHVAWSACSGSEALQRCCADRPDVVLMDLMMPEMDGVAATRELMRYCPVPILVVTASLDQQCGLVFEALGAGALDAVNAPTFGDAPTLADAQELLRKIELLGVIGRAKCTLTAPAMTGDDGG